MIIYLNMWKTNYNVYDKFTLNLYLKRIRRFYDPQIKALLLLQPMINGMTVYIDNKYFIS